MSVEVCSYRLSLRGKPVGSHILRTQATRQKVALEAKLMLQGSLGQQTVTQHSTLRAASLTSLQFSEHLQDRQEKRRYQVVFDEATGLVRAQIGNKDSAEVPYSRPYQDPLGLLYLIRRLADDTRTVRVPMLGKDVVIERLPDTVLKTALGERQSRVYLLQPGLSYVYVDDDPPHTILKLSQRIDGQLLDALIVKVSQERDMPTPPPEEPKRSKGKRRERRRPRRRLKRGQDAG